MRIGDWSSDVCSSDLCKTSVSEYAQSQNTLPADTTVAGCTNSPTKFISDLTVVDGVITVAATASIGGTITAGQGLSLTPKFAQGKPIEWKCAPAPPGIPVKYLSANCRDRKSTRLNTSH